MSVIMCCFVMTMVHCLFSTIVGLPIAKGVDHKESDADDKHYDDYLQLIAQVGLVMFRGFRTMMSSHQLIHLLDFRQR